MKAAQWIDRLKVEKRIPSDYAVAKVLGITQSAVSKLRSTDATLSDETARRLAVVLGVDPAGVLVDQLAERNSGEIRTTLSKVAADLCVLC